MFSRLLLLFIFVPVIELGIFLWIGERLRLLNTLAIILFTGVLGAALTKSQGLRVLNDFRKSTASGQLPHAAIVEGLIILVAGALLLTPGFLTDAVGFLALVPAVRSKLRKALTQYLSTRIKIITPNGPSGGNRPRRSKPLDDDNVIDV
ncbi:FxsA family protein [Haloferula chungangensis]|uniref:FxsA family protein n=1 Tax=Haloferula chungangensis TaxID=1048331 RepID=A0ABW2LBT6_9BACT